MILSHADFWGEDLRQLPGLSDEVDAALSCILERGMRGAAIESMSKK